MHLVPKVLSLSIYPALRSERRVEELERIWEGSSVKLSRCGINSSASKTCFVIQIASICSFKVLQCIWNSLQKGLSDSEDDRWKPKQDTLLCCQETQNAPWRYYALDDVRADTGGILVSGYFLGDARRARSREGIRFKWYYAMPRGHKRHPIYSLSINAPFLKFFQSKKIVLPCLDVTMIAFSRERYSEVLFLPEMARVLTECSLPLLSPVHLIILLKSN